VIRVTNHVSHNAQADALLKAAGRVVTGSGSWEGGAHALRVMAAARAGADSASLYAVDGSGLSRLNRATARGMVQLLAFMDGADDAGVFRASLPQAGDPQGLRRMGGTAAAGNLRAKTGTIRGVSALSGYVRSADGERLAFSIMVNEVPSTAEAKRVEDRVAERLASFRRAR
jgi:D-alanyl-D-alanine carboxypeptidase/D-alanyl-D-alanine-endopeptidase (penicillin-binding protein 4)